MSRYFLVVLCWYLCAGPLYGVSSSDSAKASHVLMKCSTLAEAQRVQSAFSQARSLWRPGSSSSTSPQTQPTFSLDAQSVATSCRLWMSLSLPPKSSADSFITQLRTRYALSYCALSHKLKLDRSVAEPRRADQWALDKLRAESAWSYATGRNVVVAFIDTGVDWEHEDLRTQFHVNAAEDLNHDGIFEAWSSTEIRNGVSGDIDGVDNDGNGFIDDVIGYNFVDQLSANLGDWHERDAFPTDEVGHGTNVAGVIAASADNHKGIAGLAPNARLMALRAFDVSGNAEEDDIASAVLYAVDNGARIINCSFGDIIQSQIVSDAMRYAQAHNVLVVASSGNSGGSEAHYPSDFSSCMSVGASTQEDRRTLFSTYSSQLALVAPGQGILTTAPANDYESVSGTSFSSPYTAAAAALLAEVQPSWSAEQLRTALELSALPLDSLNWSPTTGAGRLDVLSALKSQQSARLIISAPEVDAVVHRQANATISVRGCVDVPMLKSWAVDIANADSSQKWRRLLSSTQRLPDTTELIALPLSSLGDSSYYLRVEVKLYNGRTLQRMTRFTIVPSEIKLNIQTMSIWKADQRMLALVLRADRPSTIDASLQQAEHKSFATSSHLGLDHFLLLSPEGMHEQAELKIVVHASSGDNAENTSTVDVEDSRIADTCFSRKSYRSERLYLNPQSVDSAHHRFYASGLSSSARTLGCYELQGGEVRKVDSTQASLFTRGWTSKTAGSQPVCLAYAGGNTEVLSLKSDGHFGAVLFADSLKHSLWATRFADFDADGIDDIIAYRSARTGTDSLGRTIALNDVMQLYLAKGQGYQLSAECANTLRPGLFRAASTFSGPGAAVGDFDHDGNIELAFCDANGSLQISEWKNGAFQTEKLIQNSSSADAGTEFCTELDVNGDGVPEILYGSPSSSLPNEVGEYDASMWTFHLLQSTAPNRYKEIWSDHFYSAKYGRPYYNGVAAGELDGRKGDEIVLSLFPSLYIFHWNSDSSRVEPLWCRPDSWSNSPLIMDLDANGRNELAFNSSQPDSCQWWEYSLAATRIAPPTNLRLRALSATTLELRWNDDPRARRTIVEFESVDSQGRVLSSDLLSSSTQQIQHKRSIGLSYRFHAWSHESLSDTARDASTPWYTVQDAGDIVGRSCRADSDQPDQIHISFDHPITNADIPSAAWSVNSTIAGSCMVLSSVVESDSSVLLRIKRTSTSADTLSFRLDASLATNQFPPVRAELKCAMPAQTSTCCTFGFEKLVSLSSNSVVLRLSDSADASALLVANYRMSPALPISSIQFQNGDPRTLVVQFSDELAMSARGYSYLLRALPAVKSIHGVAMAEGPSSEVAWAFSATSQASAFTFPQPFSISRDRILHFAGIPQGATVVVRTIEGVLIATVKARLDDGGVEWDPLQDGGSLLSSGVYMFSVVAADGSESELHSFLLQK